MSFGVETQEVPTWPVKHGFPRTRKAKRSFSIGLPSSDCPKQQQIKPTSFKLTNQIRSDQGSASLLPTSQFHLLPSLSSRQSWTHILENPRIENIGSLFSLSLQTLVPGAKYRSQIQACFLVLSSQNYIDGCHFWETALGALLGLHLLWAAERDQEVCRAESQTKGHALSSHIKWPLLSSPSISLAFVTLESLPVVYAEVMLNGRVGAPAIFSSEPFVLWNVGASHIGQFAIKNQLLFLFFCLVTWPNRLLSGPWVKGGNMRAKHSFGCFYFFCIVLFKVIKLGTARICAAGRTSGHATGLLLIPTSNAFFPFSK